MSIETQVACFNSCRNRTLRKNIFYQDYKAAYQYLQLQQLVTFYLICFPANNSKISF
jgi:Asp-tRNA(Asn)/Glu-tRNA(Gln) amidotransferase B subunit